jgi:Xaa-Pro dipeptidase
MSSFGSGAATGYMMKMPPLADKRAAAEALCSTCSGPIYSQGLNTFQVPMAMFAVNRAKVVQSMLEQDPSAKGLILLEGGKQTTRYDTDHEPLFRQESYFHYLFGASQFSDCFGTLSLPDGEATLFIPTYGIDVAIVCGASPDFECVKVELGLDNVYAVGDLKGFVERQMKRLDETDNESFCNDSLDHEEKKGGGEPSKAKLYLLKGMNTDSGNFATPASFQGIEKFHDVRDEVALFRSISESRVFKSSAEIDVMRYTNWVSSMAHVEVMRATKPGMMEYQLESLFQHHTYTHGGCRHMSYTCICACGVSANILHYGHAGRPNSRLLTERDIALLDMGAEYNCYASDITCSFPVSGSFTNDQKSIYEAVLAAQIQVMSKLKPGVSWVEMHRVAEREILKGLVGCGILDDGGKELDEVVETMIEADLGAIFMPHGLGHFIGIDTHDVGGYPPGKPARSERPGVRKLRTARQLEEGMVITVEPGCYFINPLLDAAMSDKRQKHFLTDRVNHFRGFGGVRLEDDVLITSDGCENLTLCPRAVEEVLDVMSGGPWPPAKDLLPEMKRKWATCSEGKMEFLDIRCNPL